MFQKLCNAARNSSKLLVVGRFDSGSGSVFRNSWYSMGSLRAEAPHKAGVGGVGGGRQEMHGGSGGRSFPQ